MLVGSRTRTEGVLVHRFPHFLRKNKRLFRLVPRQNLLARRREVRVVGARANGLGELVLLFGTPGRYFETVLGFVFGSDAETEVVYFLDFVWVGGDLQAPGPGALLLDQREGNFSLGLIVTSLMFSFSRCRLYSPGPGFLLCVKIEIDLQSSRPWPIVSPLLGPFVNSEPIVYLSGEGEVFLLRRGGSTERYPSSGRSRTKVRVC